MTEPIALAVAGKHRRGGFRASESARNTRGAGRRRKLALEGRSQSGAVPEAEPPCGGLLVLGWGLVDTLAQPHRILRTPVVIVFVDKVI